MAGVLSVYVLNVLVSRRFGHAAGLLAALFLVVTPVDVVDNRNNTSDSVLMLLLLLSAWAVMRGVESGRLRWLLLCATCVGLGFNVKEMEALLVLPPLALLYAFGARVRPLSRLWHLIVAGTVTLVVSLSWIVAVDVTPASARPYVSDSGTNSELSLAVGYNGLGRLATGLLRHLPTIPILHVKIDGSIVPGISMDIGSPGLFRLFRPEIGGQSSWLLLVALVGLVVVLTGVGAPDDRHRDRAQLLFWASWLLLPALFFSVARFYHLYYLIMLAPQVSALAGICLVQLWNDYRSALTSPRRRMWAGWPLPAMLIAAGWSQAAILSGYASWNAWLGPSVEVACVLIAVVLILGRIGVRLEVTPAYTVRLDTPVMLGAILLAVPSLMAAPVAFAAESIASGNGAAWLPQAGPQAAGGFGPAPAGQGRFPGGPPPAGFLGPAGLRGPSAAQGSGTRQTRGGRSTRASQARPGTFVAGGRVAQGRSFGGPFGFGAGLGGAITFGGLDTPRLSSRLVTYLESHRHGSQFLVGTETSGYASLFILRTGQPVMALGGYQGWDKILTLRALKNLVARGRIRFFLISGGSFPVHRSSGRFPGGVDNGLTSVNASLTAWITNSCSEVPASRYGGSSTHVFSLTPGGGPGAQGPGTLYDCSAAR